MRQKVEEQRQNVSKSKKQMKISLEIRAEMRELF